MLFLNPWPWLNYFPLSLLMVYISDLISLKGTNLPCLLIVVNKHNYFNSSRTHSWYSVYTYIICTSDSFIFIFINYWHPKILSHEVQATFLRGGTRRGAGKEKLNMESKAPLLDSGIAGLSFLLFLHSSLGECSILWHNSHFFRLLTKIKVQYTCPVHTDYARQYLP